VYYTCNVLDTKQVISETFPQANLIVWYGKKLNLSQHKHAFANQKKYTTTRNKQKKLKPGLVAFYDVPPGNGAGLFSKEKISKGGFKYGKSEDKSINGEAYAPEPTRAY